MLCLAPGERKAGATPRLQNTPTACIQESLSRTRGSMSSNACVEYSAPCRYALTHSDTQHASSLLSVLALSLHSLSHYQWGY